MRETMLTTNSWGAGAGVGARAVSPVLPKLLALVAIALVATACLCAVPSKAYAEHLKGADGWTVIFNTDDQMEDNFSAKEWADDLKGMQPGDDITFTVTLKEENSAAADWYMANEVLKSLEEGAKNDAEGSAYEYLLTYTNPAGKSTTLFDSEKIGGNESNGLNDATYALDEFFFLDNLENGQTAKVDLKITMDGETEQNAYFDTLAQVQMKFAVELSSSDREKKKSSESRNVVRTGDTGILLPLSIAALVSGALVLALAIVLIRRRKNAGEEEQR